MRNIKVKNSQLVFDKFRVNKIKNLEKIKGGQFEKPHMTLDDTKLK